MPNTCLREGAAEDVGSVSRGVHPGVEYAIDARLSGCDVLTGDAVGDAVGGQSRRPTGVTEALDDLLAAPIRGFTEVFGPR